MSLLDKDVDINQTQRIARLKKGDERAFREIYDQYHQRLYYFSLKFTTSEEAAREIVQEVFIKLWTNRQAINPELSLQSYLYTIARHLNLKFLQQTARDLALKQEMVHRYAVQYHHGEEEIIYDEYIKIAKRAVEQLSPHRQLVYTMWRQDELSHQEIAKNLNISVQTVKNHLVEARRYIKEYLLLHADIPISMLLFMCACFI